MTLRPTPHRPARLLAALWGLVVTAPLSLAAAEPASGWQACTAVSDNAARLACFDRFASQAGPAAPLAPATALPKAPPVVATAPATTRNDRPVVVNLTIAEGCRNPQFSELSRLWELEPGSDCGTFGVRGFRPLSLSLIQGSSVNTQPTSASPLNNATVAQPYSRTETRVQVSVRTKIAKDLLTGGSAQGQDALWFAYTQQSYWQLFNKGLSRPFRSTDHEPEVIYTYPSDIDLPAGWRLRYTGAGVVHQSNGQSLPLSRSWNRAYLMAGAEKSDRWRLQARLWRRMPESAGSDDNPDISRYIGRAELAAHWSPSRDHTLGLTVRNNLQRDGRGSARFEWLQALGNGADNRDHSGLRLHTQIFTGYGDSLLDYNRKRTVLSVGLSLVDW